MAIAGLCCGVVGVFVASIILGPLAIIFGGVGLSHANHGAAHRTMSMWAIALGVLDVVLFVVLIAVARTHGGFYVH
jgi:hypothetical protein